MATSKKKTTWNIIKIGAACAALSSVVAFSGTAKGKFENDYLKPVVKTCLDKEFRDLKVMVEFNRQQALQDTALLRLWNRAIDVIDNGGSVR